MLTLEKILGLFEDGYKVYFGSYYGDTEVEEAEEITEEWEEVEADEWLCFESVTVDDEAKKVYIFVGDDE